MKKFQLAQIILGAVLAFVLHAAPAHAQATRTWVSGVGNDADPCSRTAPCKTFAGALTKTAAGGEISVLDAGGYGAVTINKAITITGEGTLGSILINGGTGISVAAGASDRVILRNLSIVGVPANVGISVTSGNVTIDKCFIYGFTSGGFIGGVGININGNVKVDIRDTNISNSSHGVFAQASSGFAVVTLDNVRINDAPGYGVTALTGNVFISVNRSSISGGNTAVATTSGNGVINVDNSELTNSSVAIYAGGSGSTIRVNNNSIYNNTTGFSIIAGNTVESANNNKTGGNGGGGPNGMITIQ